LDSSRADQRSGEKSGDRNSGREIIERRSIGSGERKECEESPVGRIIGVQSTSNNSNSVCQKSPSLFSSPAQRGTAPGPILFISILLKITKTLKNRLSRYVHYFSFDLLEGE
jgi:hypothetical protein